MTVQLNGDTLTVASDATVTTLLEHLNVKQQRVVVELNRRIIAKSDYADTALTDGDALEIIQFVPGG